MNRLTVNNKLAAIAPQLIYPNGSIQPSCRRFPTHPLLFFELFGLSKFKCIKGWKMNDFNHNVEFIVDQPMGAALMIKLDILRQLNGFDENFPMFFNDVDICKRIYLLEKEILFYPKVVITHEKGVSIKQKQLIMIISSQLSFLKYFIKHFPQPKYLLLNIIVMVLLLFNFPIRIITQHIKIKIN
jgi:GT2 family glycosyltransferase